MRGARLPSNGLVFLAFDGHCYMYRAVKRVLERQTARALPGRARQTLAPTQEWRRFDAARAAGAARQYCGLRLRLCGQRKLCRHCGDCHSEKTLRESAQPTSLEIMDEGGVVWDFITRGAASSGRPACRVAQRLQRPQPRFGSRCVSRQSVFTCAR